MEFFITRILGRSAPLILAPTESLPSGTCKGSLRSLAVVRTQGLALLAGRCAHARARFARWPLCARKGSLRSLAGVRMQGLALLSGRRAHARARFAQLPSCTRNG
jgi:hypothetical protein